MATFNDVWKIGMGLPEVEETTIYGTAGLKVRGKGFCRIWSERAVSYTHLPLPTPPYV